jgi:hypothetical protein
LPAHSSLAPADDANRLREILRRERDEMLTMVEQLKAEHTAALKHEQGRVAALEETYQRQLKQVQADLSKFQSQTGVGPQNGDVRFGDAAVELRDTPREVAPIEQREAGIQAGFAIGATDQAPPKQLQVSPISFASDQFLKEREMRLGYEQGFHQLLDGLNQLFAQEYLEMVGTDPSAPEFNAARTVVEEVVYIAQLVLQRARTVKHYTDEKLAELRRKVAFFESGPAGKMLGQEERTREMLLSDVVEVGSRFSDFSKVKAENARMEELTQMMSSMCKMIRDYFPQEYALFTQTHERPYDEEADAAVEIVFGRVNENANQPVHLQDQIKEFRYVQHFLATIVNDSASTVSALIRRFRELIYSLRNYFDQAFDDYCLKNGDLAPILAGGIEQADFAGIMHIAARLDDFLNLQRQSANTVATWNDMSSMYRKGQSANASLGMGTKVDSTGKDSLPNFAILAEPYAKPANAPNGIQEVTGLSGPKPKQSAAWRRSVPDNKEEEAAVRALPPDAQVNGEWWRDSNGKWQPFPPDS